jgi:hypothetical protein
VSVTLQDWKRGGETHAVATLIPLGVADRFFATSTDAGLGTCLSIADDLGLLIRATKGRTTVQYAPKGEKQARYYAFKGYGPSVQVAVEREWSRRNTADEATRPVPTGRAARQGEGGMLKSKYTGRPLVIGW